MTVESLKSLVTDMRSLAPFPHVATTVLSLASQPGVVPEQLIAVIQTDPGLTAKVLKLCNSAYYGFQREIASLEEAGNMVGVRTLTNLVLTSCSSRYFQEQSAASEDAWQGSVGAAGATPRVAQVVGRVEPERAYTSGLLLNVGELVLAQLSDEERERVEAEVQAGRSRVQAERVILGMSHAEVGARLVTRWMLPEVLIDTIRHHHAPERAERNPLLTATVHLGEALAESLAGEDDASAAESFGARYGVSDAAWELTDLLPHVLLELRPRLQSELLEAQSALAA